MKTLQNPTPRGYSRVCPYLMVNEIENLLNFLSEVFGAEITEKLPSADGSIRHAEVRLGESTIMIGKAQPGYPDQSMVYIFVHDADVVFKRALERGAEVIMEPANRFYGYREGGFKDPSGNQWWIAQVIEELSREEMRARSAKF